MSSNAPPWLLDYIRLCQERLRLQHWHIHVTLTDAPNVHNEYAIATTSTVAGSVSAWMRFKNDIAPDRDGYVTATHEVLHLAFAAMDWAVDRAIHKQPKHRRADIRHAYSTGYETGIDHLAEALAGLWMPAPGEPAPGDNTTVGAPPRAPGDHPAIVEVSGTH